MAEINNPQLRSFANEVLRPAADVLCRLKRKLAAAKVEYVAKELAAVVAGAATTDFIGDGSATDGRTRVTVADFNALVTILDQLNTYIDASGRYVATAKWANEGLRD